MLLWSVGLSWKIHNYSGVKCNSSCLVVHITYVLVYQWVLHQKIHHDSKSLRKRGFPFNRSDHKECPMWFPLSQKSTASQKRAPTRPQCTKLLYYLKPQNKKEEALSPTTKAKRTLPGSRCPILSLTPKSRAVRERNIQREHTVHTRKVHHYREYDVTVNDATNDEIMTLVR